MFFHVSLLSLFLVHFFFQSVQSDDHDLSTSSPMDLDCFNETNSFKSGPTFLNYQSNHSQPLDEFFKSRMLDLSEKHSLDVFPTQSNPKLACQTILCKISELGPAIRDQMKAVIEVGHEIEDIPRLIEISNSNFKLQQKLVSLVNSLEAFNFEDVSNLYSESISNEMKNAKVYMALLKTDLDCLEVTQDLIRLINSPQELSLPFEVKQVSILTLWEGDRQSQLKSFQESLDQSPTQKKFFPRRRARKTNVPFRFTKAEHASCLHSLTSMYSFENVKMDKCLGSKEGFCFVLCIAEDFGDKLSEGDFAG